MTIITFVRHGNTNYNAEKRMQGHMDVPLNELGKKQASLVAQRLANEPYDILISSDLSRARNTAGEISRLKNMPITAYDPKLREIDMGQLSGTTEADRIERWGPDWRKLDLRGENHERVRERGMKVVQNILKSYSGKRIIVVSHGALIRHLLVTLLENEELPPLRNTSVSTVQNNEGKWELLLYNCTNHLSGQPLS